MDSGNVASFVAGCVLFCFVSHTWIIGAGLHPLYNRMAVRRCRCQRQQPMKRLRVAHLAYGFYFHHVSTLFHHVSIMLQSCFQHGPSCFHQFPIMFPPCPHHFPCVPSLVPHTCQQRFHHASYVSHTWIMVSVPCLPQHVSLMVVGWSRICSHFDLSCEGATG